MIYKCPHCSLEYNGIHSKPVEIQTRRFPVHAFDIALSSDSRETGYARVPKECHVHGFSPNEMPDNAVFRCIGCDKLFRYGPVATLQ